MRKAGGYAFVQGGSTPGGGALVESIPSGLVTYYPSKAPLRVLRVQMTGFAVK